MPTLALTNFNIVCATLGGFITLFGLVSYLLKERFYLSEACMFLFQMSQESNRWPPVPSLTSSRSNLPPGRSCLLTKRSKFCQATAICKPRS